MYALDNDRRSYLLDRTPVCETPGELAFMLAHLQEVYLLHRSGHDFDNVNGDMIAEMLGAAESAKYELGIRVVVPIQEAQRSYGEALLYPHREAWAKERLPKPARLALVAEAVDA